MNKKLIVTLFIIGVVLYGCLGIFGGPTGDLDLVPNSADSFIILKIADFMQDADVANLYKDATGKNLSQEILKSEAESGVKITEFSKIIIFFNAREAEISMSPEESKIGFILRGTFDKSKIIENARKNQTLTESQYEGYTVYTTSEEPRLDFAFIEDGIMAAGTKGAAKDIIDVKKGKLQSIKSNSNISRISENVDMGAILVFAMQLPASAKEALNESSSGPVSMKAFSSLRSVGVSLNKAGERIEIKYASVSDDAASATKVADTLDGILKLVKGFVESGSKTEGLLEKITVSSKGEIVALQISTTVSELKEVGDELKNMTGSSEPPPRVMTKQLCEAAGGHWNECGSLCTGEPPGTACAQVCVAQCECSGIAGFSCPSGYYCKLSGEVADELGVCKPI